MAYFNPLPLPLKSPRMWTLAERVNKRGLPRRSGTFHAFIFIIASPWSRKMWSRRRVCGQIEGTPSMPAPKPRCLVHGLPGRWTLAGR